MENWRYVWREGFAKVLPQAGLVALRDALQADDGRLRQGQTTFPPPLSTCQEAAVEQCCLVAFCCWQGGGLVTVADVFAAFDEACRRVNAAVMPGDPASSRWLLNWWDDTPRPEAVRELLAEVELALAS